MTLARAWFAERPPQELVRLDQLEIIRSPLSAPVDHTRMAVLSSMPRSSTRRCPSATPQDAVFRLLVSVLEQTAAVQPESGLAENWSRPVPGNAAPSYAVPGYAAPREATMDGAHLFLPLDDAPDGPPARHRPLHGLRRTIGIACSGGFVQQFFRRPLLRAARERVGQCAYGR